MQPTQILDYLRVQFNTFRAVSFSPQEDSVSAEQVGGANVQVISEVRGSACSFWVFCPPRSPWHLGPRLLRRRFQDNFLHHGDCHSAIQKTCIPVPISHSLAWCRIAQNPSHGAPLESPEPEVITDASLFVWGAQCLGQHV